MFARDTTPRATALQLELYRRATASERAQIAVELSEAVRQTALDGSGVGIPSTRKRKCGRRFSG